MKNQFCNLTLATFALAALGIASTASAQTATRTAAATTPAASVPSSSAAAAPAKIAVIYTSEFTNPQKGISRLTAASATLDREFKPRTDELQTMQKRLETVATQLRQQQNAGSVVNPDSLQKLRDEGERLQTDMERRTQDLQRDVQRREAELVGPISDNINQQLQAFARTRGFSMMIDGSRFAGGLIVLDNTMDITDEFIADYNSKNPATGAASPTTRRP